MKKLLSRQEAAELFGVTTQTISNWINSGLLTLVIKTNRHFITSESAKNLLEKFSDVKDITHMIEQYRNTLHELTEEVRLRRKELYATRLNTNLWKNSRIASELIASTCKQLQDEEYILRPFEADILSSLIRGKSIQELSEKYHITATRVNQIAVKSSRKFGESIKKLIADKNKKIDTLTIQVRNLIIDNHHLKTFITSQPVQSEAPSYSEEQHRLIALLNTSVFDLGLNARQRTLMNTAEIKTIGELIQHKRNELLLYRNTGRKTIIELEDKLESIGLEFGTDIYKLLTSTK